MDSIDRRRLLLAGTARAQPAWPTKPVRVVVPFAPAGTTDLLARALSPELSKAFGQTFIIDNKPGAGGNLGADAIAKSAPDGYELLMGTVGRHAINGAVAGFDASSWFGLFAPAGTPMEIVNRIQQETAKAFHAPAFKERLLSQGAIPGGQPPAEFAKFIAAETKKWAQVVKASGAKVD
ncbi:MAG TPA: tripartite tricarboxylate transporter substrate-binding protein [Burkholderiaceae bacterium]|nr:tripartite tricarboxylate transporter substrate-binding protein [Burkholderiaceae bacterium]